MSDKQTPRTQAPLNTLLSEERLFPPEAAFQAQAHVRDESLHVKSGEDRVAFWAEMARQHLDWERQWTETLCWNPPYAQWFLGGRLNAAHNCLDRHLANGLGDKTAIIWEGEPGDQRTLTYAEVARAVNRLANGLKCLGVRKGDRVAIYMPMIPEAVFAMLACARIGAPHTVVFAGFSVDSLRDRIQDAEAKVLITADGGWRRGKVVPLKEIADQAVAECPSIEHVVVARRIDQGVAMRPQRDLWYHDLVKDMSEDCPAEPMDAEDILFILYTSGSTGKPKGIVHTTGGYMTGVTVSTRWDFDLKPEDVFWCTADVGWITGHSYVVYGPMANAATQVIYEGSPDYPQRNRFWEIVQRHKVSILYTAPTAIRAFMKWGTQWVESSDLSSLRLLGTVGEPINPEAWMWYHKHIGQERCPIVDTWWQTETGSIMIAPLPGLSATKPGSATRPLPGIRAAVLTADGQEVAEGGGFLALTAPWPSMLRGIWGNPRRYEETYWHKWPGVYFPGDGARKDGDGYFWLLGRVDDVMNIAGHNIGTAEVESALVDHPAVAEAAVVAIPDEIKGQAIAAFVILKEGQSPGEAMESELQAHVAMKIGAIARPKKIIFTVELPKTRSGKIMRRLLRDIAEGRALGDVTTLADAGVVEELKKKRL